VLGCALCSVWSTGWVMKGYCVLCRSVVCVVGVYVLCLMPFRKDWMLIDDVVGLPHCITLYRMRDRNIVWLCMLLLLPPLHLTTTVCTLHTTREFTWTNASTSRYMRNSTSRENVNGSVMIK
jgi:hypothetical protein